MALTTFEIGILKKNESLFDTDLNLGLVGVAESLVSQMAIIGKPAVLLSIDHILNFLAEDTNLVNEIDNSLYEYITSKLSGLGKVCFNLKCGNTDVVNSNLTIAYLIYKYKVEHLNLPNVEVATPNLFIVGKEARNSIETVNLPRLKNFGFSFVLLEDCNKQNYPLAKVTASAALKGRLHNTSWSLDVTQV